MTPTQEEELLNAVENDTGEDPADWLSPGGGELVGGERSLLAEAIHAAQSERKNPKKDSQNPFYNSSYLGLDSLLDLLRGVFNRHGISILQDVVTEAERVGCKTLLLHKSGESMQFGPLLLPAVKQDPQAYGSAISYARRYHLQAIAGIAGVDDDAETAMPVRPPIRSPHPADVNHAGQESGSVNAIVASVGRRTEKGPYCITFAEHGDFFTFDKTTAASAEISRTTQVPMTFNWKMNANPKFGRNILPEPSRV